MKKTKGFTLIEVLVSLVLLTFVILISSTLFDNAIRNTPQIEKIIEKENAMVTDMEKGIMLAKDYIIYSKKLDKTEENKPEGYDQNKDTTELITDFSFKTNQKTYRVKSVKGYFISEKLSADKSNPIGPIFNDINSSDALATFVGYGYEKPGVSEIDNIFIKKANANDTPYKLFPYGGELNPENYPPQSYNIDAVYKLAEENRDKFYKARLRARRTSPINVKDNSIQKPLGTRELLNMNYQDFSELVGEDVDTFEETANITTLFNAQNNAQKYLDSIDKTYIATGMTLNKNEQIGEMKSSLKNTDENGNKFVYYIGLPLAHRLSDFYDMNLMISKSKNSNTEYYSLFENPEETEYGDFLKKISKDGQPRYNVNFNGNDVMDYLKIPKGNYSDKGMTLENERFFLPEIKIDSVERPYYAKPYGNTIYADLGEPGSSDYAIKMKYDSNSSVQKTYIIKFNPYNYSRFLTQGGNERTGNYIIFSFNLTPDGKIKDIENKRFKRDVYTDGYSFMIYINEDGKIIQKNLKSVKRTGKRRNYQYEYDYEETDTGITVDDINLYKHDDFINNSFSDSISKDKDPRDGFSIFVVGIGEGETPNNPPIACAFLTRKENQIETELKCIDVKVLYNMDKDVIEMYSLATKSDSPVKSVLEISDVLYYNRCLLPIKIARGSDVIGAELGGVILNADAQKVMNYQFRKFMNISERNEFDSKYYAKSIVLRSNP